MGKQARRRGEPWGVGCLSDLPLDTTRGHFPVGRHLLQAVTHEGLQGWDSDGQADLLSVPGR